MDGRGTEIDLEKYRNFDFAPLTMEQLEGLARPVRDSRFGLPAGDVADLLLPGYLALENGLARCRDGSLLVAVRHEMPRCTSTMWDWWFGWHSYADERYQIWHPMDHLSARMAEDHEDAPTNKEKYIGNTSIVDEFIGEGKRMRLGITFREPSEVGLDPGELAKVGTAICGTVRDLDADVLLNHIVHLVRDKPGGCEMRSRFWFPDGKEHVGRGLIAHCSEEYGHLASFLPLLYREVTGKGN